MRKLRTSALAIATATTVALGGMTVAGAQPNGSSSTSATTTEGDSVTFSDGTAGSSALGEALGAGKPADPTAIFGSNKAGFGTQPAWAQAMYITGVIAAAGAFFGLVVAPIANFIKFNYFA